MGPAEDSSSNRDNHKGDQIADLELQLAAHAARAAKLHARLMATLDTLDSERLAYAEEISDGRRQRVALQAQLRVSKAENAAIEAERDSLREGVLHLIEKVEVCNDYSLWPHSGLATNSLAAPVKPRHLLHEQSLSTWTASARAYSAALVTALREECERERRAHSDSQRRVAALEAQLARREAELEERYDSTSTPTPTPQLVPPVSIVDSPLPRLSRDGAIRVLQQSAARNEALTHEIAGLVQKLEDAHAEVDQSPQHSSPVMPTTPPPRLHRAPSPVSPTPQRRPAPPLFHSSENSSPVSSAHAHRLLSRSPSPSTSLRPLSPRVASPPSDIARQIVAVTQDLAGLRAEERRILQTRTQSRDAQLHAPPSAPATTNSQPSFQRILLIEEECIRLRAELAASTARETALREVLGYAPGTVLVPREEDLFEENGEPMDLATPLQPTVLLNPEDL